MSINKELTISMIKDKLFEEFGKHANFKGLTVTGDRITLYTNEGYTVEDWDIYCFAMMHTTRLLTDHAIKIEAKRF